MEGLYKTLWDSIFNRQAAVREVMIVQTFHLPYESYVHALSYL